MKKQISIKVLVGVLQAFLQYVSRFKQISVKVLVGVLLSSLLLSGCSGSTQPTEPTTEQTSQSQDQSTSKLLHFYNFDVEGFEFGPDPTAQLLKKLGLNESDLAQAAKNGAFINAVVEELRKRSLEDPCLLAAICAYVDAIVHTRFMGVFYDEVAGHWDAAINAAKDYWIENPGEFQSAHATFWAFMDLADAEILVEARNCKDLMFQNKYTGKSSPDVIVLTTDQTDGVWLVFKVDIKGNIFEVPLRVTCGYQPADVQRIMGIKPSPTPTPQTQTTTPAPSGNVGSSSAPTTSGSVPQGNTGGSGGSGTTTPIPIDQPLPGTPYHKDPADSSASGANDDPGPGPSTNNGVGSQYSAAEQPTNSGYMESYEQYQESINQLEQANQQAQQQQEAARPDGSYAPSYTPPATEYTNPVEDNTSGSSSYGSVDTPSNYSEEVAPPTQGGVTEWAGPTD